MAPWCVRPSCWPIAGAGSEGWDLDTASGQLEMPMHANLQIAHRAHTIKWRPSTDLPRVTLAAVHVDECPQSSALECISQRQPLASAAPLNAGQVPPALESRLPAEQGSIHHGRTARSLTAFAQCWQQFGQTRHSEQTHIHETGRSTYNVVHM